MCKYCDGVSDFVHIDIDMGVLGTTELGLNIIPKAKILEITLTTEDCDTECFSKHLAIKCCPFCGEKL